ncbi:hypothetical protein GCM10010400_49180 [Streptomyces aculeolatus]
MIRGVVSPGPQASPATLRPGEAKTDTKDAFIIADAARAMPPALRAIDGEGKTIAELELTAGFDDDPAGKATRAANRLHGLLTQIHPPPEPVLGPRLQHPAVLTLLKRFGSPALSDPWASTGPRRGPQRHGARPGKATATPPVRTARPSHCPSRAKHRPTAATPPERPGTHHDIEAEHTGPRRDLTPRATTGPAQDCRITTRPPHRRRHPPSHGNSCRRTSEGAPLRTEERAPFSVR